MQKRQEVLKTRWQKSPQDLASLRRLLSPCRLARLCLCKNGTVSSKLFRSRQQAVANLILRRNERWRATALWRVGCRRERNSRPNLPLLRDPIAVKRAADIRKADRMESRGTRKSSCYRLAATRNSKDLEETACPPQRERKRCIRRVASAMARKRGKQPQSTPNPTEWSWLPRIIAEARDRTKSILAAGPNEQLFTR